MISSRSFSSDTHREKIVRNQETKMQVLCIKREKEREKEKRKKKNKKKKEKKSFEMKTQNGEKSAQKTS